jgi:hypothetical protein
MLMRLFSSWQVEQREFLHETEAYPVSLGSQADEPRAESAMGKGERSRAETQAHNISSRQKENRSRTAGEVGKREGAAEEGCLELTEPAAASTRQACMLELNRSMCLAVHSAKKATDHEQQQPE